MVGWSFGRPSSHHTKLKIVGFMFPLDLKILRRACRTMYKVWILAAVIQFDCQTWFLYGSRQFWIGSLDILIPYGKSNEEEATLAPTAVQGRYKRNKPSLLALQNGFNIFLN